MQVLVSCWHRKRVILMDRHVTRRALVRLRDHVADCRPDDPSRMTDEDVLLQFRVVLVDGPPRAKRSSVADAVPLRNVAVASR